MSAAQVEARDHDLVLRHGRVIDPETGLDAVRDVGIVGGRIRTISREPLLGRRLIDATGLVVAPGWIDVHSHSHTLAGHRLQALDGVTTVLELEAGVTPVSEAYRRSHAEGRPLNYGYSSSWAQARMTCVGRFKVEPTVDSALAHLGLPAWQVPASKVQVQRILERLEVDLAAGALGIGLLVGYAPDIHPEEYREVATLAARWGVPTYTHARDLVEQSPDVIIDGAVEIVRAAAETGAHMHYCHINSTSLRHVDRVSELVAKVRREGSRVTTEAYPYGAGMTAIGAQFLDPSRLSRRGMTPQSIVYAPTGERVATTERLLELRSCDPAGLAIAHYLNEADPGERIFIDRALLSPGTVIGSDAMPLTGIAASDEWPVARGAVTHPRTAGTFSKVIRRYVRELGAMTLAEAIYKCSYAPAAMLEDSIPAMRSKGRVQVGCDADLVVFDPATVRDRATYENSTMSSEGYAHVVVNGELLVTDGRLDVGLLPGRPVRR